MDQKMKRREKERKEGREERKKGKKEGKRERKERRKGREKERKEGREERKKKKYSWWLNACQNDGRRLLRTKGEVFWTKNKNRTKFWGCIKIEQNRNESKEQQKRWQNPCL